MESEWWLINRVCFSTISVDLCAMAFSPWYISSRNWRQVWHFPNNYKSNNSTSFPHSCRSDCNTLHYITFPKPAAEKQQTAKNYVFSHYRKVSKYNWGNRMHTCKPTHNFSFSEIVFSLLELHTKQPNQSFLFSSSLCSSICTSLSTMFISSTSLSCSMLSNKQHLELATAHIKREAVYHIW